MTGNKIFRWSVMAVLAGLAALSITIQDIQPLQAAKQRVNLISYSRNLEILGDKDGNLDQLIGELQGYRTYSATGSIAGTTVSVPGILPTDTINEIVVYSSQSLIAGTTAIIGAVGEGQIILQSKLPMRASVLLNWTLTQKGGSDPSSTTLTINTTGYAFEVKMGSVPGVGMSSANAICAAMNSHPWLSQLVRCSTTGGASNNYFSTATITPLTPSMVGQAFLGSIQQNFASLDDFNGKMSSAATNLGVYTVQNYGFASISSSGNVVTSTGRPWTSNDYIELKTVGYRPIQ